MKLFKNIRILLAVAVSVLLASGLSSCRKETDDENGANYYINLSPKELFATKKGYAVDGEPIKLQVASNIYWQLTQPDNEEWISVDKKGGSGTEEIVFTVDVNKGVARQAKFVFETNGSLKQELIVRQESAEKVLEYIRVGFGDGASLENVNAYEEWRHEGVGALRSQFWGQGTLVDKASASSGYDEASGGGNILFAETGGNGSIFQIN